MKILPLVFFVAGGALVAWFFGYSGIFCFVIGVFVGAFNVLWGEHIKKADLQAPRGKDANDRYN